MPAPTGCRGRPEPPCTRSTSPRSSSSRRRRWPSWAPPPPPTAGRWPLDLRHDWARGLREAGLDPNQATAWSAEGLLPFLPPDAQDALLDNITRLSAPGSQLATENLPDASRSVPMLADRMREATDRWREHGFDVEMTDLWYAGERHGVVEYLNTHGWTATATPVTELSAAQGLSLPVRDDAAFASLGYVTATRT